MTRPAEYPPGVTERSRPNAPTQHVIGCPCCEAEIAVTIHTIRKPPSALRNMALRRGWAERKGFFYCPEHSHAKH